MLLINIAALCGLIFALACIGMGVLFRRDVGVSVGVVLLAWWLVACSVWHMGAAWQWQHVQENYDLRPKQTRAN